MSRSHFSDRPSEGASTVALSLFLLVASSATAQAQGAGSSWGVGGPIRARVVRVASLGFAGFV